MGFMGLVSLMSGAGTGYQQGVDKQHDWDRQKTLDKIRTDEADRVAQDWTRVNGMRDAAARVAAPVQAVPVDDTPVGPMTAAVNAGMPAQDVPPPRQFAPQQQVATGGWMSGDPQPVTTAPVQPQTANPAMPLSQAPSAAPMPAAAPPATPAATQPAVTVLGQPTGRKFRIGDQIVDEHDVPTALAAANSKVGTLERQSQYLQGIDPEMAVKLHDTADRLRNEGASHVIDQNLANAPTVDEIKAAKTPLTFPVSGLDTFNSLGLMRIPPGTKGQWSVQTLPSGQEVADFKLLDANGQSFGNSARTLESVLTMSAQERQKAGDTQFKTAAEIAHEAAALKEQGREHDQSDATTRATNAASVGASISNNRANIAKDYAVAGLNVDGTPNAANESLVDGIGQGRIAPPSSLAMRSAKGQQLMAEVTAKYPNYDATAYGARQVAVKSFATGKDGQAIQSGNTALNHLETIEQLATAQKNGDVPLFNKIANRFAQETGQAAPTNLQAAITMVAPEITKAVVGAGGGVSDREHAAKTLDPNASPAQILGSVGTIKEIFGGRLSEAARTYKRTTGYDDFSDKFLSPAAQRIYAARHAAADTTATPAATTASPFSADAIAAELARRKQGK